MRLLFVFKQWSMFQLTCVLPIPRHHRNLWWCLEADLLDAKSTLKFHWAVFRRGQCGRDKRHHRTADAERTVDRWSWWTDERRSSAWCWTDSQCPSVTLSQQHAAVTRTSLRQTCPSGCTHQRQHRCHVHTAHVDRCHVDWLSHVDTADVDTAHVDTADVELVLTTVDTL